MGIRDRRNIIPHIKEQMLVLLVLLALVLTLVSHLLLRQLGWHHQIWKGAWFYLSLFVCFVALSLRLLS